MSRRERSVAVEKRGLLGYSGRVTWSGLVGRGIRDDGTLGTIEFFEPPQDSGRRQIEADLERRGGSLFSAEVLADGWTIENNNRRSDYRRAIDDALGQIVANNAARAAVQAETADYDATTPEGRAAAAARRERALRLAAIRADKIKATIDGSDSLAARRLAGRLAFIEASNGLTGAYAAAIDRGEDPAEAAAALVPDPTADEPVEESSPLDRLYPLEDDQYYVETFDALPAGWPEFYVHFVDAGAPTLQPDQYYVDTFASLPAPWQNLYQQAIAETA
jgi:hypothetical protein